jgi:hypothetical protein
MVTNIGQDLLAGIGCRPIALVRREHANETKLHINGTQTSENICIGTIEETAVTQTSGNRCGHPVSQDSPASIVHPSSETDTRSASRYFLLELEDGEEHGEYDASDNNSHDRDQDRFDQRRETLHFSLYLLVIEICDLLQQ